MSLPTSARPFRFVHSPELPDLLEQLGVSLMVTTYQAGKLAVFRVHQGRLALLLRSFEHAMGLAVSKRRMAIGTRYQVWFLESDQRLAHQIDPQAHYDACFLPRRCHVTGDVAIHEIAWGHRSDAAGNIAAQVEADELWMVNTRFSCLCTLDHEYSFVPRWRPNVVSELAGDDRCHLNGLAMKDGKPSCVTMFAETDEPQGWRAAKHGGGCLIDVASGEVILHGLSMPHSPRWYEETLYVLDSGCGRLVAVDAVRGECTTVAEFPGYARGLALHGDFAFVGLSKIRDSATFRDIPIADDRDRLRCGVWVYHLKENREVAFIEFSGDVAEVFDVQVLPERTNATVIGLHKETVQSVFSIPPHISWEGLSVRQKAASVKSSSDNITENRDVGHPQYLGQHRLQRDAPFTAEVWYLTYPSRVDGGCLQAAKLFLPIGTPPEHGWPVSIWVHGLGDPAEQLTRWPCTKGSWRRSRGQLAGCWAQHGIATLTPWLPGDGPSEPFASYSPFSLPRNLCALADAIGMLQRMAIEPCSQAGRANAFAPKLDLDRVILRTDCAASPLLVAFAADLERMVEGVQIRALVADDFQPGILHNEAYLGPKLNQLAPESAAAIRCVWLRVLWALFQQNQWPMEHLLSAGAIELFHQPTPTSHGARAAIMTTQLVPPASSRMAPLVVDRVKQDRGRTPAGTEVRDWLYGEGMLDWARTEDQAGMLRHPFYREHFADSDPFFVENIEPFSPDIPLLVVGRTGDDPGLLPGTPSRSQMCQHLTAPKVSTLRAWGWDVNLLQCPTNQGTSFGGGAAQKWVLECLQHLL